MRLSRFTPLLIALGLLLAPAASARDTTIYAAASLKVALDEVLIGYRAQTGAGAVAAYAASSALAKQIEAGAPADIFISADQEWMDHLAKAGLIQTDTRFTFLGNQLVLVIERSRAKRLTIDRTLDLVALLDGRRLAVGEVNAVPAGRYAKAALTRLGLWAKVADKLAPAENVRAALALVARGEAGAAIVYATDARLEPGVAIVGVFPADSHAPIEYPVALVKGADTAKAKPLLDFLKSEEGRRHFMNQGFTVLTR
ncbi:molybdate ABC transporter substrate-binding protein [Niveispirillum lacus]|uniref:Molybdate ABC transporter substrate-binding protein n=1 Tax=Niveispirillum lacus TaxID=1981099 RepID=A0A255Z0G3_9PROT|nr:molybdate ABC transporter substrate-binding protein [Niveispirillum lacus]OYQ34946.1 molybdate ABC transporter substrate-binding protein [Niveispirillum lacus]